MQSAIRRGEVSMIISDWLKGVFRQIGIMPEAEQVIFLFTNTNKEPVEIILEPWCEPYIIPPDATVEITSNVVPKEPIEIEYRGDLIVIWGDAGAIMDVYQDKKKLEPMFEESSFMRGAKSSE